MSAKNERDEIVYEALANGEAAVLDLRTRRFYTLNETAHRVFEGLRAGQAVEAIVADLVEAYDVDIEECRDEVERIGSQLHAAGLLP